jgi:hypothetical protein
MHRSVPLKFRITSSWTVVSDEVAVSIIVRTEMLAAYMPDKCPLSGKIRTYTTKPVINDTEAGTIQTVRHALSESPSKMDLKRG